MVNYTARRSHGAYLATILGTLLPLVLAGCTAEVSVGFPGRREVPGQAGMACVDHLSVVYDAGPDVVVDTINAQVSPPAVYVAVHTKDGKSAEIRRLLFRCRELFKTHTLARRGDGNAPYLQLALYGADAFFTHAEGPGSRAAAGIAEFVYIDSNAPPNQLAPIVQADRPW